MREENTYDFKSNELCDFAGKAQNESDEDDEAKIMERFRNTLAGSEPCEDGDGEGMKIPK